MSALDESLPTDARPAPPAEHAPDRGALEEGAPQPGKPSANGRAAAAVRAVSLAAPSWWDRTDRWTAAAGERLNPILVKESRQALKSKQFLITFTLVLACAWIGTMLGVAFIGPNIYHGFYGPFMFQVYYLILGFPLLVIVPFQAFRSLAGEREDGTYELLSITTLKPRQVVGGKLNSAVLQMLVYFSAMSPCLAFTYLLRGIDFPTILYVLFYTFIGSLGLSILSLVAATITQEKHWQVVFSVLLVVGLMFAFSISVALVADSLNHMSRMFMQPEFWWGNWAFLSGFFSYAVLCCLIAAGQLTFASENRSTVLRVVMVAQQVLFTGWMAWCFAKWPPQEELLYAYLTVLGVHWFVMGAFMTSEHAELSSRVKRSLPQSFLGRAFLTWFNPGPGTGYVFALTNLLAAVVLGFVGLFSYLAYLPGAANFNMGQIPNLSYYAWTGFCYITIYLGLGRLVTRWVRRVSRVGLLLGVLLHVLLLLAGAAVPLTVHLMTPDVREGYSLIEITNPFWTLYEVGRGRLGGELDVLLYALPAAAFLVLVLNLPSVLAEIRHVRIARPERVREEDAALDALLHPHQPVPLSPFE